MITPISYVYVDCVKRVAQGLSIEDGEELARGLYCIRPHERFRTHILGSAWLYYYVMLARFWAPMYVEIALEQTDPRRVYDYELTLQAGVRALNVWKVCQREAGIVVAFPKVKASTVEAAQPPPDEWSWASIAAVAALLALFVWAYPYPASGSVLPAAFTPFYIDQASGASSLNAGTTSANAGGSSAAAFTYAGGTFVRATGVYTVASGDPQNDGVTTGTYASVYTTSGATSATFVAQITARDHTTITVDVTTLKWGVATSVSETAAAATLKVSGAWSDESVLAGLGTFTVPTSTKINMKQATYTQTATRVCAIAAAATAAFWLSGYNTTPGDLDADTTNALTKPLIAINSTFLLQFTGASQVVSSLNVTGNRSGTIFQPSGLNHIVVRCRSENTSSNAAAIAFTNATNAGNSVAYCWFKCPSTATSSGTVSFNQVETVIGSVSEGGGLATWNFTAAMILVNCISLNAVGAGFLASTTAIRAFSNTVYGATVDAVKWTGTPGSVSCIVGLLASGLNSSTATTNGINNASGTNTTNVFRACNDYYNVTNAEVGMGDSYAFFPQTDSNPVVVSASNMTPVVGSNALKNGFPGIYENETFSSYQNIGAVQQAPDAGGGIIGDGSSW